MIRYPLMVLALVILMASCQNGSDGNEQNYSKPPIGEDASLPHLVTGEDGYLYISWVEKKDSGLTEFKFSKLVNDSWSSPELIASGTNWFVNWADYPMVAVDKQGNMIAHYLAKSSVGTYSYDVHVMLKKFDSAGWNGPIIPHKDNTPTEHGFVTLLPLNDSTFEIAWLDGRKTGRMDHSSAGLGSMTLRGATIDMDGTISEEVELDNSVCDCCQTTGARTLEGSVFIYRDKELGIRDISITKEFLDAWPFPRSVHDDNWAIDGCPVNGPRAEAIDDNLVVAWFTAANGQPQVKISFSTNGGDTFRNPFIVDTTSPIGRVDIVLLNANTAMMSWLDQTEDASIIKARKISIDGRMEPEVVVSQTSAERSSGFPQLAKHQDHVYFAWTSIESETTSIQLKRMRVF